MENTDKANLLIVEDDRFIRKLYREILKDIDKIVVYELDSAENAISETKKHKPDIVIMDYRLPGMNGLEATKQIIMAHPDTIVLVVSGDDRSTLEEEMLEVGAISFLKKPVRGKLLYFTIMNFVEIILTKKRLKKQIDQASVKKAEKKASKAHKDGGKPSPKAAEDKSTTFVDSFSNAGMTDSATNLLAEKTDMKGAESFISQLGSDFEYVEDFLDTYDSLKYTVESLSTIVESEIINDISKRIRDHNAKLNTLLEFPTIVYTLSSIHDFLDMNDINGMPDVPMKKLAVFLGDFFDMYDKWVKSVFISRDAEDIHFLDVTLMSFGLQMDSIFSDVNVLAEYDDNAVDEGGSVEFF